MAYVLSNFGTTRPFHVLMSCRNPYVEVRRLRFLQKVNQCWPH